MLNTTTKKGSTLLQETHCVLRGLPAEGRSKSTKLDRFGVSDEVPDQVKS